MNEDSINEDLDPVHEALERFDQATEAYTRQRQDARDDLRFVAGEQWSSDPSGDELRMTVNLLNPFLRQITSEARTANPAIKVIPIGNKADVATADVRSGLIKNVEQQSDAEAIYQQSLWYAAAAGEGYIFIDSEYCGDESFDQDLVLKGCPNPEKVFLDPLHERVDGQDAEWAFVIEDVAHDVLKRQFPESKLAEGLKMLGWDRLALPGDWIAKETVRLAKYWVKERRPKTIWLVQDPLTMEQSTVTEKPGDDVLVLNKRKSFETVVKCYLMNGLEILEETTWPGKNIPIVKVTGDTFYVGGQRVQNGAVRHAKSPQQQYNYMTSRQTEMIDLAPKNAFVGATGQFENNPEKWANANRENYGFLDYTPIALGGTPVPPPTRVSGLDMNAFSGVAQTRQQALEDLKLVFGLHDAALGRTQDDGASGIALQQRTEQSSRSTYHYFDNLLIAIKAVGRILNECIPFFYDTERMIRIVKPTDEEQLIAINSYSNKNKYDMTQGEYTVTVSTGPAYASKRQEAYEALNAIMSALPESGKFIGDLVASQIDSPVAQKAAARLKATIPPEVLAASDDGEDQDMAPAEQLKKVQQDLSMAQQQLKMKDLENQELQVKVKVAEDKSALELTKMDIEGDNKRQQMQLDREMAQAEIELKYKELELQERRLDIEDKKLRIVAIQAADEIHDKTKPVQNIGGEMDTSIGSDTNIGGAVD